MNPVYGAYFRLKNTGENSGKFGPCECCGKHVNSTFMLVTFRRYIRWQDKSEGLTQYIPGVPSNLFGHKKCLSGFTNQHRFMQVENV